MLKSLSQEMQQFINKDDSLTKLLRKISRYLAIAWAGLWSIFIWGTVLGYGYSSEYIATAFIFTIGFLGSSVVPWKWETIGSILLFFEGILMLVLAIQIEGRCPPSVQVLLCLLLALPPLFAGGTLFVVSRRSRSINHPTEKIDLVV